MENVKFNYLFRDEANYKIFGFIIFLNPDRIPLKYIELTIRFYLIDKSFFYPERWGLPNLVFDDCGGMWHEFESLEITFEQRTTVITVREFLEKLLKV